MLSCTQISDNNNPKRKFTALKVGPFFKPGHKLEHATEKKWEHIDLCFVF